MKRYVRARWTCVEGLARYMQNGSCVFTRCIETMRSHRKALLFAIASMTLALEAVAQVHPESLQKILHGTEVSSLVVVGETGVPLKAQSSYPVNTLVYPDGQVIYRVEWALIRGEVTRMERSFPRGTVFRIDSLELKDDRLEVKLAARTHNGGRLKLMLGSGWQLRLDDASLLQVLGRFLSFEAAIATFPGSSSPVRQDSATVVNAAAKDALLQTYERSSSDPSPQERVSLQQIKQTLDLLDKEILRQQGDVNRASAGIASALRACHTVYAPLHDLGALKVSEEFAAVEAKLGTQLVPQSVADANDLTRVYNHCARLATLRQAGDPSGQQYGAGSKNSLYTGAFLSRVGTAAAKEEFATIVDSLRDMEELSTDVRTIVAIERSLDAKNYPAALDGYAILQAGGEEPDPIRMYLSLSQPVKDDLTSLAEAKQAASAIPSSTLPGKLRLLSMLRGSLTDSSGRALTNEYLTEQSRVTVLDLKAGLEGLQPFDKTCLRGELVAERMSEFQIKARINKLQTCLDQSGSLVALESDGENLKLLRTFLGDQLYSELQDKARGINPATLEVARLDAREKTLVAARTRADEARRVEALERQTAADDIINAALIIVQLDEQFERQQVLGYLTKSNEERAKLAGLIRKYRSPAVWAQIRERFDAVKQGLTISRIYKAEELLAAARPRS